MFIVQCEGWWGWVDVLGQDSPRRHVVWLLLSVGLCASEQQQRQVEPHGAELWDVAGITGSGGLAAARSGAAVNMEERWQPSCRPEEYNVTNILGESSFNSFEFRIIQGVSKWLSRFKLFNWFRTSKLTNGTTNSFVKNLKVSNESFALHSG